MADPNTRQGKRTPVTLKIKFKSETLEQFIERYAVDVSQGGIFIRTKEPLAVGTQMRFEFQLRDASPLIGGEGTVVWTRENDPSRPAIAPGMGVRFDRLADGSQQVLERILSEKAKQAPVRTNDAGTKPPLFTDTPTRVAPPPVQDALLGNEPAGLRGTASERRIRNDSFNDQHTPLPKPMPFHSDADEFPEEAFEEATKVRALDELVAQTALDSGQQLGGAPNPLDELAARRAAAAAAPAPAPAGRQDATVTDPEPVEETLPPGGTAVGVPKAPFDRDSAPNLPSPPIAGGANDAHADAPPKRLLDTTPSPRNEGAADPMEQFQKTKLGMEPVPVQTRQATGPVPVAPSSPPPAPPLVAKDAPKPPGVRAVAAEPTAPTRLPEQRKSRAPLVILLLVILAGGGAALWFFVLRDMVAEESGNKTAGNGGSNKKDPGPGSQKVETVEPGSGSGGVKTPAGSGSETGSAEPPPKAEVVELEIAASVDKAQIEIVGTDQKGPAPFKAKLDKDKAYKVRVFAPHHLALELDVKGGQPDKPVAKLQPKPRVLDIASTPTGALIFIDDAPTAHVTPYKYTLEPAKAAKKTVRVRLYKAGFKGLEKVVAADAYVEDDVAEVFKVDEKLAAAPVVIRPNPGSGSAGSGSATGGSGTPAGGSGTPAGGSGETPPPAGSGTPPPPAGSGAEPEPGFMKGGAGDTPPP
ncbi:MAG: TIGR02266 family protein [Deltaproteobacteria bacterium]|nr:TIGR02266 family protein [Deltaproteobacteria bacterium]